MKGIGEQSIFAFLLSFQNYFRMVSSKGKVYWGFSFRLGGELYLSPMHSDIICLEEGQIIPLLFWKLVNEDLKVPREPLTLALSNPFHAVHPRLSPGLRTLLETCGQLTYPSHSTGIHCLTWTAVIL